MVFSKKYDPEERKIWLYQKMANFCEPKGFILLPTKHQFRKRTALGFQTLILSTSHYEDTTIFELHLGVRNELIEKMAFQFTNGLSLFQQDSMTLVASMGKLQGQLYQRYDIKNEADAVNAVSIIVEQLEDFGLGWLEKNQSIGAIHQSLNKLPLKKTNYMPNQVYRCFRGLVAAKLANASNYVELKTAYSAYISWLEAPDHQKIAFERLKHVLEGFSAN